jgi:hypothetical protein
VRRVLRCVAWSVRSEGPESILAAALGRDLKGKLSPLLCALAIGFAFGSPGVAYALYLLVALMWLIPDRRIERVLTLLGVSTLRGKVRRAGRAPGAARAAPS